MRRFVLEQTRMRWRRPISKPNLRVGIVVLFFEKWDRELNSQSVEGNGRIVNLDPRAPSVPTREVPLLYNHISELRAIRNCQTDPSL
jgi:hypothetical protein